VEDAEEKSLCPKCGQLVSKSDVYCKSCEARLSELAREMQRTKASEVYQRRLSTSKRLLKLLISPSEAMKDIALAPTYEGIAVIFIADALVVIVGVWLVLQRIQIFGPNSNTVMGLASSALVLTVPTSLILFVVKWAVKSWIVRYACDNGSAWEFRSAASVTSYAYIADTVLGMFGLVLSWFLLPTLQIDTTNLDAARQSMNDFQAQISWLRLMYTLPLLLLGLLWKSYLGALGTRFGTRERCFVAQGFAVFFGLGLISLLVSLIL